MCQRQSLTAIQWNLTGGAEFRRYTFKRGAFHAQRPTGSVIAPERDRHRFTFSPDSQAVLSGRHGGMIRPSDGRDTHRFGDRREALYRAMQAASIIGNAWTLSPDNNDLFLPNE